MTHRAFYTRCIPSYTFLLLLLLLIPIFSGCQRIQQVVTPDKITISGVCGDKNRVLNLGFYAYFAPVSYSANEDPAADSFNTHQGYEADLLTALEAMKDIGVSFSRRGIAEWPGIWLKAADSRIRYYRGRNYDS